MNPQNKIVVLCGSSGTGKDLLASIIRLVGYNFVTSISTRPMRDGETQGNPYRFTNNKEIEQMTLNDELVECRSYDTLVDNISERWYYAVAKSEIKDDKNYIVVLDIEGLNDFRRYYGDRVVSILLETNESIREDRAKLRGGFNQTEWNRRILADREDFSSDNVEVCDYKIKNNGDIIYPLSMILNVLQSNKN